MSEQGPGGFARGCVIGFSLLRFDLGAIDRFDGSLAEARQSFRATAVSALVYWLTMLLAGAFDLGTFVRVPVLVTEISAFAVSMFAVPVLVASLALRAGRVPLFITVYNYLAVALTLFWFAVIGAAVLSDVMAQIISVLFFPLQLWSILVTVGAFRRALAIGWQSAAALALADFLIGWMIGDWSAAIVQTIVQS